MSRAALSRDVAREQAVYGRDPVLPGIDTLTARYVTHRFLPHTHDALVLGVIERGAEEFRLRGQTHLAPAGSVVVVPPGEVHTGQAGSEDGWAYRVLYLHPDWLLGATGTGFRGAVLQDPILAEAVRRAQLALTQPHSTPLARETLLRDALGLLLRRHADARWREAPSALPTVPEAVRSVRERLDGQPEQPVTLSELAAGVSLSPAHLARSFRAVMGVPPHAYQMAARVRLARRLLDAGCAPAAVALSAGFADQAHLTRVFKRVVGVPPGHYRRRV